MRRIKERSNMREIKWGIRFHLYISVFRSCCSNIRRRWSWYKCCDSGYDMKVVMACCQFVTPDLINLSWKYGLFARRTITLPQAIPLIRMVDVYVTFDGATGTVATTGTANGDNALQAKSSCNRYQWRWRVWIYKSLSGATEWYLMREPMACSCHYGEFYIWRSCDYRFDWF